MSALTRGRELVQAEVFRKRLENVTTEMAITLSRTSGSPSVTEAKDFSTALFDSGGDQIGFSGFVSFHVASSLLGVDAVRAAHDIESIRPGDIFCCNDPYTSGAMHQGDVGIVMPFFHDGELVGWGFLNEHLLDVGGAGISGMAPTAGDVYSEALLFPAVRIGSGNRIDPEWRRMIEVNVRVPGPVINDIQSMVAGANVGQEKVSRLIDKYGLADFESLTGIAKDLTEDAVRTRIARLPDGVYRSIDWCEYDGRGEDRLLDVSCALTVDGSDLRFEFASASAQIDAFVNGAKPAVWGQCMTALFCVLLYDVPVNAGIWRPISIEVGPPGTVVNPTPPAPVSNAHMEVGMRVSKLVVDVLSQACSACDDASIRARIAGQPQDGFPVGFFFGPNQYDQPWVTVFHDAAVGVGGGAQTVGDGLDCYGAHCMLACGMPDIEVQELMDPKLYLYRRLNPTSGGAGTTRGGLGIDEAALIRGTKDVVGVTMSSVERVPPQGFGGGSPASSGAYFFVRGSDALRRFESGSWPSFGEADASWEQPPSKAAGLSLSEGDIVVWRGGGGGGLGDPLFRDPDLVAADLRNGYVTSTIAELVYGVKLDAGAADAEATRAHRDELRRRRLGRDPARSAAPPPTPGVVLEKVNGEATCSACHLALDEGDGVVRDSPLVELYGVLGMDIRSRPPDADVVILRETACPGCGSLLSAEVALAAAGEVSEPARGGDPTG
jgi:N-methylhydantoinase B